jgi:hypothetical protein
MVRQHDLDRGMGAMEVPQRFGKPVVHRAGEADPQPSVEQAPERGDRVAASLGGGERCPRVWQERLAGVREAHRTSIAMKSVSQAGISKGQGLGRDRRDDLR